MLRKLLNTGYPKDSLVEICQYVLNLYNVKNTPTNLNQLIFEHIEFPSILTVMDCLKEYGIDSAAIRKGEYDYKDLEVPFICPIQQAEWSHWCFTVVTAVDERGIRYLDPIKNIENVISKSDFEEMDKGVILLLNGECAKNEINYFENKQKSHKKKLSQYLPILLFTIFWIFTITYGLINTSYPLNGLGTIFMAIITTGWLLGVLLVWHEVDAHNPFLKEVCGGGGKRNCIAVLNSKGASVLGLSWSILGFSYFTTIILSQLLFGPSNILFMPYWFLSAILAFPYSFYSIYYQWKIVKQWCPLCLAVQVVLFLSGTLAVTYFYQYGFNIVSLSPLINLLFIGVSVLISTFHLIPLLKSAKEAKNYEKKWKRLRYNPYIFNTLLKKETKVIYSTDGMGILIGNSNAKHEIIKVCNPYCGPCANAHPELEELIHLNSNLKVRVIFTASGEKTDIKTPPVQHLLAIQERDGMEVVKKALDYWYRAETKDYTVFANEYPIKEELTQQGEKIEAMKNWCNQMKIRATPTFFIDGYELPDSYQIGELKHILKETR
ncbi:vitamin K epoxide reductase family protein [Sphingobacterium sp. GVS05A]|uniref:vitamin K epoxide reductase family protein n=1 Tax=Sphingobacterium sp. GVS05A TaxID=2862679 RepID=UPI001CBB0903|nr:vitamin K epoxide reductase family protein [Sphingobacterium sp. GVS05A]